MELNEKDKFSLHQPRFDYHHQNGVYVFTINGREFSAVLKDLPRPVEIHRKMNAVDILKRADVGQIMECTCLNSPLVAGLTTPVGLFPPEDVVREMERSDDILEYVVEDVVPYESWMQGRHNIVSLSADLNFVIQHIDAFYTSLDVNDLIVEEVEEKEDALGIDDFNDDDTTSDDDDWMVDDEDEENMNLT